MKACPSCKLFAFWALLAGLQWENSVAVECSGETKAEIVLDITDRPAQILCFPANSTEEADGQAVQIRVDNAGITKTWKISLVLLSMECYGSDHVRVTSGSNPLTTTWCTNGTFNESEHKAEMIVEGYDRYSVSIRGKWEFSSARILATVYREARDCTSCSGLYCCTSVNKRTSSPLPATPSNAALNPDQDAAQVRCISVKLRCSDLPYCGLSSIQGDSTNTSSNCADSTASPPHSGIDMVKFEIYLIAGVGGAFGIGFIVLFFGFYLYYRGKDWGTPQETPGSKCDSVIGDINKMGITTDDFATADVAAVRIQRISRSRELYSFEDT